MRTTIRIDDELHQAAKRLAAETNRTLTEVIEASLRDSFARRRAAGAQAPIDLPVFRGSTLQPGVDFDNAAELLDILEDDD
jgi:hypothetical protein